MAIMTFPIIMRATQEALAAVPDLYREGSFGLGAGRFSHGISHRASFRYPWNTRRHYFGNRANRG